MTALKSKGQMTRRRSFGATVLGRGQGVPDENKLQEPGGPPITPLQLLLLCKYLDNAAMHETNSEEYISSCGDDLSIFD